MGDKTERPEKIHLCEKFFGTLSTVSLEKKGGRVEYLRADKANEMIECQKSIIEQYQLDLAKPIYKCFLVSDCTMFEGSTAISVHASKEGAAKFVAECVAYDNLRPECPDSEGEEEWDEYTVKDKAWREGHPGGENCTCVDEYVTSELPYNVI